MRLRFAHWVFASAEEVFAFHEDPANLARLLEGWRTFSLHAHQGSIRPGCVTSVWERILRVPIRMDFVHDLYDPPRRFGEHQLSGPFARFFHVHEFLPMFGGVLVQDLLDLRLKRALGGELATRALVAPRMRRFFEERHRALDRIFGLPRAAAAAPRMVPSLSGEPGDAARRLSGV